MNVKRLPLLFLFLLAVLSSCQKNKLSSTVATLTMPPIEAASHSKTPATITLLKANSNFARFGNIESPGSGCNYGCCMLTYAKSSHQSADANTFVDCLDNSFGWSINFGRSGGDGSANRPPHPDPSCPACYMQPNASDYKLLALLGLTDQSSRDDFQAARDLIAPYTTVLLHAIKNPKASAKEKMLMLTDYYTQNYILPGRPLSTDEEYFLFAYAGTLFSPEMVLEGDHCLKLFSADLGDVYTGPGTPTGPSPSVIGNLGIPVNFMGGTYEPPLPGLGIAVPK